MTGESRWFISFVKTPFHSQLETLKSGKKVSVSLLVQKNLIALGSDLSFQEEVLVLHHFTALADQEWH